MRARVIFAASFVVVIGALCLSACAEVKPWERGILAQPSMDPASKSQNFKAEFVRHTFDVREGATGGNATAGGGCGCN